MPTKQRVNIRGQYYEIIRDDQGRIISMEKWSSGGGGGGGCFIVAATYNDPTTVGLFRKYRDDVLLNSSLGIIFYYFYYKYSPHYANIIRKSPIVQKVTLVILNFIKKILLRRYRFG